MFSSGLHWRPNPSLTHMWKKAMRTWESLRRLAPVQQWEKGDLQAQAHYFPACPWIVFTKAASTSGQVELRSDILLFFFFFKRGN